MDNKKQNKSLSCVLIACVAAPIIMIGAVAQAQQTTPTGIPKIPPFKEKPVVALVPKVQPKPLPKPAPVIVTPIAISSYTDPETGLKLASLTKSIEVVNSFTNKDGSIAFVVTARDKTGAAIEVNEGDVWVKTSEGQIATSTVETMKAAKAPIAVTVVMDMSGSMSNHKNKVISTTNNLFKKLPVHTRCNAISFGSSFEHFDGSGMPCNVLSVRGDLLADGNTPAYEALMQALTKLSGLEGYQKLVLFITDGDPSDQPNEKVLRKLKADTKVIFFWVGGNIQDAEQRFRFIADDFIAESSDPFNALSRYIDAFSAQIINQSVVTVSASRADQ